MTRAGDELTLSDEVGALPYLAVGTPPACGGERRK
jgi:hypothetical protein